MDENHVLNRLTGETEEKPVFMKFAPLLDPNQYLIGKYDHIYSAIRDNLSEFIEPNTRFAKLASIHNASYIDSFFNYLSSKLLNVGFPHALEFYGTFIGIQENFRFNIFDEVDFLQNQPAFFKKEGSAFTVETEGFVLTSLNHNDNREDEDEDEEKEDNNDSRKFKTPLHIDEAATTLPLLDFEDLDITDADKTLYSIDENEDLELMDHLDDEQNPVDKESNVRINKRDDDSDSENSELNYSTDEGEEAEEGEEGEEDEEDEEKSEWDDYSGEESDGLTDEDEKIIIHIKNFPTQVICMEKCDGTLDELFLNGCMDEEMSASMIFQVIMILSMYQNIFRFTHNDLHTNNILFCKTTIEFLDYEFKGRRFRVPTYGRIFKIIDFGRSIYTFQGRTYCSDSFAARGDAATQYNCEPFFDETKPRIEPNPSFDLCRLACSIFDFVIDDPAMPVHHMDQFQRLIHTWCQDDNCKNVLYKKNGEERYPQFKLYKMIARTVHRHVPEHYLDHPLFAAFQR